nr:hypothetical protein [Tanacetum cinerariifolium]
MKPQLDLYVRLGEMLGLGSLTSGMRVRLGPVMVWMVFPRLDPGSTVLVDPDKPCTERKPVKARCSDGKGRRYEKDEIVAIVEGGPMNDDDNDLAKERELLATLIEKLKCEIDESKNQLARRNSKEYASQMEIECAKKKAQIKLYKTQEDKELDKVIELENKVKVLDNIVYKTGQSVQTMNMLNNKCRTSFAKPEFLKKPQRANPCLYDIGCYNDNLALMLAFDSDEVIRLEKESRSKLSDLIRPFDYDKLKKLYDLFVPQREKSSEQRYFSERSRLSHTNVNNGKSKESFNKQTTLLEKRMDESIPLDKKKFKQWKFRIQQYLQHEHYALWEVIEFRDSYVVPTNDTFIVSASEGTATKKGRTVSLTTEDMQKRRNDVKVRTTLLLALLDEHQLRFSKYKTAQELWAAILKTFSGNEATKKTKNNLLKQQYGNFKAEGKETLEQTFNRLHAIVSQLEFMDVEIKQDDLNQKLLTSLSP